MGICWSEPPVAPVQSRSPIYPEKPTPYQPPVTQYPPQYYNSQYTYAVKPQPQPQQVYYQYPQQQYPYTYSQAYPPQAYQQYPIQQQQQQQQQGSIVPALVGGFVLGAMVDDILDPTD